MKLKLLMIFFISFQLVSSQSKQTKIVKEINRNGYHISYNENLRLDESGRNNTEFYLFTQKSSPEDNFIENLNLLIQNLENLNLDLNKFVEITERQIKTNGNLIESKRAKSNGIEFHKIIYESNYNGIELKFLQYDFIKNKKAFVLTYSAKTKDYPLYIDVMEKVMNSFKI